MPKIYVAVVGTGIVGSSFLDQLDAIPAAESPFQLISLTSSKKHLFFPEAPLRPGTWRDALAQAPQTASLDTLTGKLQSLVGDSRVVVVDNTASYDIANQYPAWVRSGLNVVTPNKKAFSGSKSLYEDIVAGARQSGVKVLHEATVGAGLPIINTLNEMLATGDRVLKIEGVFSGTMSYIFNEFSNGKEDGPSFSSVVSVARDKGYTEPHPADDLNGADVARKLTILTRLITHALYSSSPSKHNLPQLESYASVQTESLVPKELDGVVTGDEFLARLPAHDAHFDQMRKEAAKAGQVLRFVGVVDPVNGIVKAGLEKYPTSHPFATSLGGSDNIIMFHTERYTRPLIVQGAGAGAAVTAMGVLGDLFKLV